MCRGIESSDAGQGEVLRTGIGPLSHRGDACPSRDRCERGWSNRGGGSSLLVGREAQGMCVVSSLACC